jgi:hypothetical protein
MPEDARAKWSKRMKTDPLFRRRKIEHWRWLIEDAQRRGWPPPENASGGLEFYERIHDEWKRERAEADPVAFARENAEVEAAAADWKREYVEKAAAVAVEHAMGYPTSDRGDLWPGWARLRTAREGGVDLTISAEPTRGWRRSFSRRREAVTGEVTAPRDRGNIGAIDGRPYTSFKDDVTALRRGGRDDEAERLLLRIVDEAERVASSGGQEPPPWWYEQLAIIYKKRNDVAAEIAILERYASRATGRNAKHTPRLLARLAKARAAGQRAE